MESERPEQRTAFGDNQSILIHTEATIVVLDDMQYTVTRKDIRLKMKWLPLLVCLDYSQNNIIISSRHMLKKDLSGDSNI